MGILRIMSVGRPGVGKSTMGNLLLTGNPQRPFDTSCASVSCTLKPTTTIIDDCAYVDVPGIPDTDPRRSAEFYDMIVNEAKKELNVILFVFKYERQDPAAYKLAELLFRELNQSNALKILVINDHTNYTLGKSPTMADYEEKARAISDLTKINFKHKIAFTTETMSEELAGLKFLLSETKSYKSKHLKSFSELREYVDELEKNKDYQEEVINTGRRRIKEIQGNLDLLQGAVVRAGCVAGKVLRSVFAFGRLKSFIVNPAELRAQNIIQLKMELEAWKMAISEINLDQTTREFQKSCKQFEELKRALIIQVN